MTPAGAPCGRFTWERAVRDDPEVTGGLLLVLLSLATYMDEDGTQARPGQQRLAHDTGLAERSVRRHLATALRRGWLVEAARGGRRGDGRTHATVYVATLPQPATAGRFTGASTGQSHSLNRPIAPPQPATGDRPPRHSHHVTSTTPAPDAGLALAGGGGGLGAELRALRRQHGLDDGALWSDKACADAERRAVEAGYAAADVPDALRRVAADAATRQPGRVVGAGPWWAPDVADLEAHRRRRQEAAERQKTTAVAACQRCDEHGWRFDHDDSKGVRCAHDDPPTPDQQARP